MTEFSRFPQGTRIVQVVEIETPAIPEVSYIWLKEELQKVYGQNTGLRELSLEEIEKILQKVALKNPFSFEKFVFMV